jgi:hypothetical protein
MAKQNESGAVGSALKVFSAYYLGLTVVTFALFAATGLSSNAGVTIAVLMASALAASDRYAQLCASQLPRGGDLARLVAGSLILSLILSSALLVGWLALNGISPADLAAQIGLSQIPVGYLVAGGVVMVGFNALALWLGYGPLARFTSRHRAKRD